MAIASPLGTAVKRTEDPRLITGAGNYLDDIKLPGMTHAAILRSPYAHAKIVSIDTSRAAAMPGVVAVFTGKDAESELNPLPCAWAAGGASRRRGRRRHEQPQHAPRPRGRRREVDRRGGRGRHRRDAGAGGRRARRDRRRTGSRSRWWSTPRARPPTERRSCTRTRRTTWPSPGPSATPTAPPPRSTAPRSWSSSASSTSASSPTRSTCAEPSAAGMRARTSTRSG